MEEIMTNGCREESISSTISYKFTIKYVLTLILGTIKTLLVLPALFSCTDTVMPAAQPTGNGSVVTRVALDDTDSPALRKKIDIFAFDNSKAGHLDSYQHIESFDGGDIKFRSQNGEKSVFICTDSQREVYDWAVVNSMESLGKVHVDLRKEKRDALCATASGVMTAGSGDVHYMKLRRIASEVVLQSIRCDFSGTGYEDETITDVSVYLTNVNTQCSLTADGHILPTETVNTGGLDLDEVADFAEPDLIFCTIQEDIDRTASDIGMSFICYPNTSTKESPGTPFTRLVIEGKVQGETFWWPIDINRDDSIENPGIHRNCRYVFDVTLTRKGNKDPEIAIRKESAIISMSAMPWNEKEEQRIPFQKAKVVLSEEDNMEDINLMVFTGQEIEESLWREVRDAKELEFELSLVKGRRYTIAAIANLGRKLKVKDREEWDDMVVETDLRDCLSNAIPMSGSAEDIIWGQDETISLDMSRLAAKISIRMDRSQLSGDVTMEARSLRLCNVPRYISITGPSKAESRYDVYECGYELDAVRCSPLNTAGHKGLSEEVSVYMLENMQGPDLDEETASFIEIELDYMSSGLVSYDSPLIYRFHLTDENGGYDISRNCHYHMVVAPEGDGLTLSGWSIDKSGIGPVVPVFRMLPGDYVEGHVGDTLRVWCECYPRTAPFDPGYEELDFDKSRGIYDYRVDDDSHGVTLYLKKPGSGIVYMSAGEPINKSGMVLVKVKS